MAEHTSTPLHEAVKRADLAAMRALISQGADVNALDAHGLPALAYLLHHMNWLGFMLTIEMREMISILSQAGAEPTLKGAGEIAIREAQANVTSAIENMEAQKFADLINGMQHRA